ncbi:hypothetical protein, partial [Phascolarctobacterium faecium]|uniref:hypothetical protein n=1 Tax=Phascolarctobacterium faecium TaxID=33025 RepID=UPI003AB4859B
EPEELPDYSPLRSCERQEGALKACLRFSVFVRRKAFSFALNLADTRNSDSSVTRLKINLFNEVFYR